MKLLIFLGTRPEVIKLAPIIAQAKLENHELDVVFSGQHRELVEPLLNFFDIRPTRNLQAMEPGQSLVGLSARILLAQDQLIDIRPDWVIVQGDTTTAFIAAYWAFLRGLKIAHVEAGLRTHDLHQPFPEEANRQLISRLANLHFVPTKTAQAALLDENVAVSKIRLVGNTAIDALHYTLMRMEDQRDLIDQKMVDWINGRRLVLITAHRRENMGKPLKNVCKGIRQLMESSADLCAILPVHPNPQIGPIIQQELAGNPQVKLCEPLDYVNFVYLMNKASLLLTDSGGLQEEGPSLRKPILVMREVTERPEGVQAGFAKLVGTDQEKIFRESLSALSNGCQGIGENPYGDGRSSQRIIDALKSDILIR